MGLFDFLKKKEIKRIADLSLECESLHSKINELESRIQGLRKYEGIVDTEQKIGELLDNAQKEASTIVATAQSEARNLRIEAESVLSEANRKAVLANEKSNSVLSNAELEAESIRKDAKYKADALKHKAELLMDNATKQAGRIIDNAHIKAEEIAGDAYKLKLESDNLEKTVNALKNTINGYGYDYIIPMYTLIDQLADDFGYTEAGEELKRARGRTRLMVKNNTAAICNYVEDYRKTTAINFIIDAFNGKVDTILTSVKQDNYGVLQQKIMDAYFLVNNLGKAFRNAVITPQYVKSRIEELKWASICVELRNKEREEQRRIKKQIRDEEIAKKEFEKAIRDSEKEEAILKKAIEKAQLEISKATEDQKAKYESKLAELSERLKAAEEKNKKAMSMAQQTKSGHVYIISNIGSFGENVYKIGMTRRLEPLDRVKELGDASVPFPFDVHAVIYSNDAPKLETFLHKCFLINQMNKVNPRKEFFKVSIADIRKRVDSMNINAKWTMLADAYEWRETITVEKNITENSAVRDEWENRQKAAMDRVEYESECIEDEN